ncbi:MAG TPA: N-acetyl-gamma-glutamyl-phosphate reductase [Solirubrobacterales bacterium]
MTGNSQNGNGIGHQRKKVLVAGATGAVGSLVAELVDKHPELELAGITARDTEDANSPIGKKLFEIYPEHRVDCEFQLVSDLDLPSFDAAVIAYPAGPAARLADELLDAGLKVVDSCAAFRFEKVETYEEWYGDHGAPHLNSSATYGLPELNRNQLRKAELVGNPGCYPTASVLALAPLAARGLIDDVVIDAKSGVSGAGKRGENAPPFIGTFDNMRPYGIPGHKHEPEIREQLRLLGYGGGLSFVPHLIPIDQGELVSCYVKPTRGVDPDELSEMYQQTYAAELFVELAEELPTAREVQQTNICRVHPTMNKARDRIMVFATIDNLWKGGASQAIQNLNLVLGLPEPAGIDVAVALSAEAKTIEKMPLDRAPVSA